MKHPAPFVLLAVLAAGCAATRVSNLSEAPPASASGRPSAVYVANFEIDPAAIKQSSGMLGEAQQESQQRPKLLAGILGGHGPLGGPPTADEAVGSLAQSITDSLNGKQLGVPAIHLQPGQPPPADGWLVGGQIVNVDPGNAARSATVGFGSGQSQVEVQVTVTAYRDGVQTPVMTFNDAAQSRKSPGGLVAMNPYAMAAKFVVNRNATEREIKQVGDQIATEIADYMTGKQTSSPAL